MEEILKQDDLPKGLRYFCENYGSIASEGLIECLKNKDYDRARSGILIWLDGQMDKLIEKTKMI